MNSTESRESMPHSYFHMFTASPQYPLVPYNHPAHRLMTVDMAALLLNPAIVGPALAINHRYGAELIKRYPILGYFNRYPMIAAVPVLKILKWLLALGLLKSVNRYLNNLALNHWIRKSDIARWNWPREIAVVTGGSGGFGLLIVKGLAAKGVRVAVLDVVPMSTSVKSSNVFYQQCDITDPEALHTAAEAIRAKFGHPTILVNNAGIGHASPILSVPPEKLKRIFGVNVLSHYYTCAEFVPAMARNDKGHIIGLASLASFFTIGEVTDYAATKSAVLAFHEGLSQELKHRYKAPNVHSTTVHPSFARTAIVGTKFPENRLGKLMEPNVVSDAVLNQIFSARGGQIILPERLYFISMLRAFPNWVQELLRDDKGKLCNEEVTMERA